MSEEITVEEIIEALRDESGVGAANFLAMAGVQLRPTITIFNPICISCGAITHDMVMIHEHTGDGEDREMVFCRTCVEEDFCTPEPSPNFTQHSAHRIPMHEAITHEQTGLWRDREESIRLAMEDIDDDGPFVGHMFSREGDEIALRHPGWEEWTEDLEPRPGDVIEPDPEEEAQQEKPQRIRA